MDQVTIRLTREQFSSVAELRAVWVNGSGAEVATLDADKNKLPFFPKENNLSLVGGEG